MSGRGGAVPKFASFKPKQTTEEDHASPPSRSHESGGAARDRKEDSLTNKPRSRDHHSREDGHRRHHHSRHRRSRSRDRSTVKDDEIKGNEVAIKTSIPLPLPSDGLFIIDTKGDEENLIYGNVHRYSVPHFRRYGNGSVLGCSKYVKIDREFSDEKGIVLSDHRGCFPAKREKYVFSKSEKQGTRLLKLCPETQGPEVDLDADFLSFSSKGKKKKRAEIDGFLSEDEHQHYRSIEGKAKDVLEQGFAYATDSSSSDIEDGRDLTMDSFIKARSVELTGMVEKHPHDVEAWCELIDHQDMLLGLGENGTRKVTQAERKSTAEIKIHIYEKALRLMDSSLMVSLERLSIGLMNEGAKVWDIKKQSSRWEDMTKKHPRSIVLWKKFVDFKQTNFSTFSYEEHRTLFSTKTNLLRSLILEESHPESELHGLYQSIIYTLLRATLFMREAGFQEQSLAIWEGILEYNFSCPSDNATKSEPELRELFRDFWESEVPRIGEKGAMGWLCYVRDSSSSVPDPRSDAELPEISVRDDKLVFEKWVAAENQQSKESREPARTMDDVTENDPYRVILFDDIEPFLIRLPLAKDIHLGKLLFSAFLAFCQLPQPSISGPCACSPLREDSFVRTELLAYEKTVLQEQLMASNEEQDDKSSIFAQYPFQNYVISADNLFAGNRWFKSLQPWTAIYGNDFAPVKYQWIRNALQALSITSSYFAEYYLAFEFSNEPENIKKTAKNLLKRHPSSLELYNAYGMIEWNRGNKEVAKTVFSSAIGMSNSMSDEERSKIFLLRKSLVWALLEDENSTEAFQQLLGTVDVSPAIILKMRQELLAARDHSVSTGQTFSAVTQTELLAMLEYFTTSLGTRVQGDILSALPVFHKFSDVLSSRGLGKSSENELLHQSAARLLHFHAVSGPYRPAFLRENLIHSLTLFPQNTILLSLFAWNESHLSIDKKVRSILLSTILTPGTVISHMFAVRHEILHGNVHSQHAAFEKAVSGDSDTKFNPGVWRLYLLWCLQTKGFEDKAKDVFYRGMGMCPWAKGFMMLAFEELSEKMGFEELKGVYRVLVEKELRIHIDLED